MAIQQNIGRDLTRNLPMVGGGALGVGMPFGLREFADVQDGEAFSLLGNPGSTLHKLTRPSVAYGLGMGALTGALYLVSAGPDSLEDFYLAHSATAIPSGIASAVLPVEAPGGGSGQTAGMGRSRSSPSRSQQSQSASEFSPNGGRSPATQPAN